MKHYLFALTVSSTVLAPQIWASMSHNQVGFGPFVGGGVVSVQDSQVRHNSGFRLRGVRQFGLGGGISVGPQLEFVNSISNIRRADDNISQIANYDSRIAAGGARLSVAITDSNLPKEIYLAATYGGGISKLSVDENQQNYFRSNLYHDIGVRYSAAEAGFKIPLQADFNVEVGVLASLISYDQSDAIGTFEAEDARSGNVSLTAGEISTDESTLEEKVVQKTYSATMGLSFEF